MEGRAAALSGLMSFEGSLPPKYYLKSYRTLGIRVEPPARMISWISPSLSLDLGILENLLGLQKVHVELLELGPGERIREVIAVFEQLDFNTSELMAGESALGLHV